MTTDQNVKREVQYVEAPASFNVAYCTPDGFSCRLTLRSDNGKDLLEKAGTALTFLIEHGCTPETNNHRNSNVQGKQCPIHQCWMKLYQKDGKSWYSHKTDDGWCYGKTKKEG